MLRQLRPGLNNTRVVCRISRQLSQTVVCVCVCVCVCVHPVSGAGARQIEEREPRSVEAVGGAHEEAYT